MSGDRQRLRSHLDALVATGLGWVQRHRKLPLWCSGISFVAIVALGIGSGMSGNLIPDSGEGALTRKGLVVFGGAIVALISNLLAYLFQNRDSALLSRASELEREAGRFLDERDELLSRLAEHGALDERRLALIDANRAMRETLEQALLVDAARPAGTAQQMLESAGLYLIASMGFDPGEAWVLSVFQVSGAGDTATLHRIAVLRAIPSDRAARSWRRNQGFVGAAWVSNRDTIIEDCHNPQVAADYPVPPECRREGDAGRYRSMAVIPVQLGPDRDVWGVVAASSDHVGRFRRDPGNKRVQTVDTVRLIARVTGLMAAAFARSGQ